MRSSTFLTTVVVYLAGIVASTVNPLSSSDFDLNNHILVDSYALDSGVEVRVFAQKNGSSDPAARGLSLASPAFGTLQKRVDIQAWPCSTQCGPTDLLKPNNNDCTNLYNSLYAQSRWFHVAAGERFIVWLGECATALVNNIGDSITYDYQSFAGTTHWLNGECIVRRGLGRGHCLYEGTAFNPTTANAVYTVVSHKSNWGL